jgi:hypothetical protein
MDHRPRSKSVSYEGEDPRLLLLLVFRTESKEKGDGAAEWMDGSYIQWNIVVTRDGGMMGDERLPFPSNKKRKKNLRARRRSPGRQDRAAAGPFLVRRRRLRRPSI